MAALTDLAGPADIETALLRPLTDSETPYAVDLLNKAAALLRLAAPSIDARLAAYETDPTDPSAVSPLAVAAVLGGAVKRYLVNARGLTSTSDTLGDVTHAEFYALRGDTEIRGTLQITPADLAALFPDRVRLRAKSIRMRPGLAPRPVGRYGPIPTLAQAVEAVVSYDAANVVFDTPLVVNYVQGDGLN